MNIEVSETLLEKIASLQTYEQEKFSLANPEPDALALSFSWTYSEDGKGADGESWAWRPHARYNVSVNDKDEAFIYRDELDKYAYDNVVEHPLSSTYEEDEE